MGGLFEKGRAKTGGRKKGTPNKAFAGVKKCFTELLENYTSSKDFMADFAALEPKERLMLVEKLANYVVPKMQSVAVEDVDKNKKSTVDLLIQLRDGNRDVIPNLSEGDEDESSEE